MNVRDALPIRRLVPTKTPTGLNWSEHKPDLRIDFNEHCAYCGSYDGFRNTYFEVDHFVPKSLFILTGKIQYCQYDNLVYSCKFCNNKKLSKWPSNDENKSTIGDKGFVDPCDQLYDTHLYRTKDGAILWLTPLGKWMATEAFKFDERANSIKLLWELNERRKLINTFVEQLTKHQEGSDDYNRIKREAEKLSLDYVMIHKDLMEYYNTI